MLLIHNKDEGISSLDQTCPEKFDGPLLNEEPRTPPKVLNVDKHQEPSNDKNVDQKPPTPKVLNIDQKPRTDHKIFSVKSPNAAVESTESCIPHKQSPVAPTNTKRSSVDIYVKEHKHNIDKLMQALKKPAHDPFGFSGVSKPVNISPGSIASEDNIDTASVLKDEIHNASIEPEQNIDTASIIKDEIHNASSIEPEQNIDTTNLSRDEVNNTNIESDRNLCTASLSKDSGTCDDIEPDSNIETNCVLEDVHQTVVAGNITETKNTIVTASVLTDALSNYGPDEFEVNYNEPTSNCGFHSVSELERIFPANSVSERPSLTSPGFDDDAVFEPVLYDSDIERFSPDNSLESVYRRPSLAAQEVDDDDAVFEPVQYDSDSEQGITRHLSVASRKN